MLKLHFQHENNILKCHHKNSISRIHFSETDVFNSDVKNQLTSFLPKKSSTTFFKEFKNENFVCFCLIAIICRYVSHSLALLMDRAYPKPEVPWRY